MNVPSSASMLPAEVAASYDRIAHRWASDDFDRSNGVGQHLRAIGFVALRGPALDIGCGSSGRLFELLRTSGFEVEGLDLSGEMLRLARTAHPQVTLHHADICEWIAPKCYSFITAWDSVWHVPLRRQRDVMLKLCGMLSPGGVLIFTAGGTQTEHEVVDHHMAVPMYHASLGVAGIIRALTDGGCVLRHFEYDQPGQPHVYFIAQRP